MNRQEIFDKVVIICQDLFENDDIEYTNDLSSSDIQEWDSLTHLSLLSDIEEEFDIKFTLDEMVNKKTLGELVDTIKDHLG